MGQGWPWKFNVRIFRLVRIRLRRTIFRSRARVGVDSSGGHPAMPDRGYMKQLPPQGGLI